MSRGGQCCRVALLAEGAVCREGVNAAGSPSSRRAWIEISQNANEERKGEVALLAEGVDRNVYIVKTKRGMIGRPPHGARVKIQFHSANR